jgi:hypothetical protein
MKVLKIIGDIDINAQLPEDAEVITTKIDDYMVAEYEEPFDMIFCIHVLQTMWGTRVNGVIDKMVKELKPMGELHVYVPAVEYAAKVLAKNNPDPVALYMIWGSQDRPFHCGFTLMWLRALVEETGAVVRSANVGIFTLNFNDQEARVPQHAVVATVIPD